MAYKFRYVFNPDTFKDLVKQAEKPLQLSETTQETAKFVSKLIDLLDSCVVTHELLEVNDEEWDRFFEILSERYDRTSEFWRDVDSIDGEFTAQVALEKALLRVPSEQRDIFV